MASIEKCEEGYTVRWRATAGDQYRRICPDFETALLPNWDIAQARASIFDRRPQERASTPELRAIFQAYLDDRARVPGLATLKQRHIGQQLLLAWLRANHPRGRLLPDLLSRSFLPAIFTCMIEERENTKLSAAQRVRMVEGAWEWAFDSEECGEDVPPPRKLDIPDPLPELRRVAPTRAQCDAGIAEAWDWCAHLMIVMRFTGMRNHQIMRLTWYDVDMENALLTVRPELGKSKQESRGRVVPISPPLVAELAGRRVGEGFLVKTRGEARRIDDPALHRAERLCGAPSEIRRQSDLKPHRAGRHRAQGEGPRRACPRRHGRRVLAQDSAHGGRAGGRREDPAGRWGWRAGCSASAFGGAVMKDATTPEWLTLAREQVVTPDGQYQSVTCVPHLPFMPDPWNGVLVLAESPNLAANFSSPQVREHAALGFRPIVPDGLEDGGLRIIAALVEALTGDEK